MTIKNKLPLFLLTLSLVSLFSTQSFSQDYNFDFENIENNKAKDWWCKEKEGYRVTIDKSIKYSGEHSILIESTNAKSREDFQPITYSIPVNFIGKKIKFSAYIKTENVTEGWAGLWLRIDPHLAFNNMQREGIIKTTDWQCYELELNIHERAEKIVFGALLSGMGKVWVDKIKITIDGKLLQHVNKTSENNKKTKKKDWLHYYSLSIYHIQKKEYDSSLYYLNKAIKLAKDKDLLFLYDFKTQINFNKNDFSVEKILEDFNIAINTSIELDDLDSKLIFLNYLSSFYSSSGKKKEFIKIQKEIVYNLEIIKKTNQDYYNNLIKTKSLSLCESYNYITKAYIFLNDSKNAEKYNINTYKNLQEKKGKSYFFWLREYYINEGEISFINKNYDSSKLFFNKAYERDIDYDSRNFQKNYYLGKIAYMEESYNDAINFLEEYKYDENKIWQEDYYWYLAKAYKKINKLNKANLYLEKHIEYLSNSKERKDTLVLNLRQAEIKRSKLEFENLKTQKEENESYFLYGLISLSVLVALGFLYIVRNKRNNKQKFKALIEQLNKKEKNPNTDSITPAKQKLDITEETIEKILNGLIKLEKNQYYLSTDCNTTNVAKKIKTNTTYLSKVIRYHYQSNFNTYINNLRINYAVYRLKNDTKFRAYSIQSISEEIGYKSPDSFTKYFKKRTGLLPSYYIKQLNSQNTQNNTKHYKSIN